MKLAHLTVLVLFAASLGAADANRFADDTLELTKPEAWRFVSPSEKTQIVAIARYPEAHEGVNPTFQIVRVEAPGPLLATPPKDVLPMFVPSLRAAYAGFVLETDVQPVTVAGREAAELVARYAVVRDDKTLPARARMILIPHGKAFLFIGLSGPSDGDAQSRKELEKILGTLKLK